MSEIDPRRARDPVLFVACAAALAISVLVGIESLSWIGRTFPGFLILENGVIASAGLSHWPAADGSIFQREIVALNGAPVAGAAGVARAVEAEPPGTLFRYTVRADGPSRVIDVPSRRFERFDWFALFGTYLFCGIGLCGTALCIRYLRGSDQLATGTFMPLFAVGIWALTAVDLYGPYRLFRLHALFEALLGPATLHLVLSFPRPAALGGRRVVVVPMAYAAGALLALANQLWLYDPHGYRITHAAAQTAFGLALVTFVLTLAGHWIGARDFETRERLKVVSVGSVLALIPQVALLLLAAVTGDEAPQNALAWSGMLFPASVAYAVLRQNLLGVDEMVRRILNYAVLTMGVTVLYATAVFLFEAVFHRAPFGSRAGFALALGPASVLVLLPLRDRLQSAIDRTFFRAAWDFRRVIETTSARLASVTELSVISVEIQRAVGETLHPVGMALYVRRASGEQLTCVDSSCPTPEALPPLLAAVAESAVACDGVGGTLAVPFRVDGALVAALLLGRPLSGRLYGGYDRSLLLTLANQGALAIENALALEQLRELNRDLEAKVEKRTRSLAETLQELRDTQAQLVHREKMASIGQFVAGIAHEMNNPLSFIEGNLHFLRDYTGRLTAALERYERVEKARSGELPRELRAIRGELDLDHVVRDLGSVLDGCSEGVTRTSGLVRDLRTFSRLDHAELMPLDLHEAIESTLNLLRGPLKEIAVVRDFEQIPPVECLGGQINQVLMNLLANAAEAVEPGGRIAIRTRAIGEERVAVEVEDDGCGIAPEHLERIFDPFFTTKDPGKGTGLGLSISYGVVARHGGRLEVRSTLGGGSCFRLELPVHWRPPESVPA